MCLIVNHRRVTFIIKKNHHHREKAILMPLNNSSLLEIFFLIIKISNDKVIENKKRDFMPYQFLVVESDCFRLQLYTLVYKHISFEKKNFFENFQIKNTHTMTTEN